MKAFLLAAGHGTRLRPLTDHTPKCLIPVAGKPMLGHWLDLCRRNGIDEVLINLHAHADQVRHYIEQSRSGVNVTISEEEVLLGSAGTLRANRNYVGDEPFWVFYADVLTNCDLHPMFELRRRRDSVATIGVYEVPDPTRCGIVDVAQDGSVLAFEEKPPHPRSNAAFSGLMLATPSIFDFIPPISPADIGFHVLPQLIGKMSAVKITDFIIDVGTLANYDLANRTWPGMRAKG